MDFTLTEEQDAIVEVATQVLGGTVTHERLKELERSGGDRFLPDVWQEVAKANLLGIALPEAHGGTGFGILEACLVLREIGRTCAPVPYLACVVGAAMPIGAFGSPDQQARWLPGVVDGSTILTAALSEAGSYSSPTAPTTTATPDGAGGYRISGEKWHVAALDRAARVLVPASTPDGGVVLALVDPAADGVRTEALLTTASTPEWLLVLDGVAVDADDVLGGDTPAGAEALAWTIDRCVVATCAVQAGVCRQALDLTARYTSERHQFGVPIATFQAVAHRAADAYTDALGVETTMLQAAWRLAEGLPADDEVHIAKFWAAEGGQRMIHGCQHLHGGIGVDTDYPLHRCFRWSKELELTFGGATEHLRRLGATLA